MPDWHQGVRLIHASPNASGKRQVLGTLMLGILASSQRYAHIAGVRGEAVAAQALGLKNLVGVASVRQALDRPWILDVDAIIKPL